MNPSLCRSPLRTDKACYVAYALFDLLLDGPAGWPPRLNYAGAGRSHKEDQR
jgi:hypothetical protein